MSADEPEDGVSMEPLPPIGAMAPDEKSDRAGEKLPPKAEDPENKGSDPIARTPCGV